MAYGCTAVAIQNRELVLSAGIMVTRQQLEIAVSHIRLGSCDPSLDAFLSRLVEAYKSGLPLNASAVVISKASHPLDLMVDGYLLVGRDRSVLLGRCGPVDDYKNVLKEELENSLAILQRLNSGRPRVLQWLQVMWAKLRLAAFEAAVDTHAPTSPDLVKVYRAQACLVRAQGLALSDLMRILRQTPDAAPIVLWYDRTLSIGRRMVAAEELAPEVWGPPPLPITMSHQPSAVTPALPAAGATVACGPHMHGMAAVAAVRPEQLMPVQMAVGPLSAPGTTVSPTGARVASDADLEEGPGRAGAPADSSGGSRPGPASGPGLAMGFAGGATACIPPLKWPKRCDMAAPAAPKAFAKTGRLSADSLREPRQNARSSRGPAATTTATSTSGSVPVRPQAANRRSAGREAAVPALATRALAPVASVPPPVANDSRASTARRGRQRASKSRGSDAVRKGLQPSSGAAHAANGVLAAATTAISPGAGQGAGGEWTGMSHTIAVQLHGLWSEDCVVGPETIQRCSPHHKFNNAMMTFASAKVSALSPLPVADTSPRARPTRTSKARAAAASTVLVVPVPITESLLNRSSRGSAQEDDATSSALVERLSAWVTASKAASANVLLMPYAHNKTFSLLVIFNPGMPPYLLSTGRRHVHWTLACNLCASRYLHVRSMCIDRAATA